jgi:hypothetical protein
MENTPAKSFFARIFASRIAGLVCLMIVLPASVQIDRLSPLPFQDMEPVSPLDLQQPAAIAPQVKRLRNAIIGQESGANFKAVNRHSGALGYAQVMPNNLPRWSQEALGYVVNRQQFLNSPQLQIAIVDHKLNQYWQRSLKAAKGNEAVAIMRVAAWWYSGKPERYTSHRVEYYNGHRYPSIADYSHSVLKRYRSLGDSDNAWQPNLDRGT